MIYICVNLVVEYLSNQPGDFLPPRLRVQL
jgi:hypothetical protein